MDHRSIKKIVCFLIIAGSGIFTVSGQQKKFQADTLSLTKLRQDKSQVFFRSYKDSVPGARDVHTTHVINLKVAPDFKLADAHSFSVKAYLTVQFGNDTLTTGSQAIVLRVDYDPAKPYQAKDAAVKLRFPFVKYRLDSLKETGAPSGEAVMISRYLEYDHYVIPDLTDSVIVQRMNLSPDMGYADFSWGAVKWAGQYELEYAYIDNYADHGVYFKPEKLAFSFRSNCTRVTLTGTSYRIPVVYESGYLVFRVRPLGYWGANLDKMVSGKWSAAGSGVSLKGQKIGDENVFFCRITGNGVQEADQKNWQYTAAFAEEGKRKDVVNYLDGTLRSRQVLSNLSTEKNVMVKETIYDNNGRPAIETLPAPIIGSVVQPPIRYQAGFNVDAAGKPYAWPDFDQDRRLDGQPDQMKSGSGAAKYYSAANPVIDLNSVGTPRQMAYVADAEGYPFTQKEYTPDQTGRLRRVGESGDQLHLDSTGATHVKKYYYGMPSQQELDKLFGNDAGLAVHYSKEVTIDENKQASVAYKNIRGQVVATALEGLHPANLDSIPEGNPQNLVVDLAGGYNQIDRHDGTISASFPLVVTQATNLTLDYSLSKDTLAFPVCMEAQKLCVNCVYDLRVKLTDESGHEMASETKTIGTLGDLRAHGHGPVRYSLPSIGRRLEIGTYTISKVLSVNQAAIDTLISKYLADKCWDGLFPPIVVAQDKLVGSKTEIMHIAGSCDDNPSAPHYPEINYLPLPGVYAGPGHCCTILPPPDFQESLFQMLNDLSPGGQYGGINGDKLSVFNENNLLLSRGNWKKPIRPYRDVDGSPLLIDTIINGQRQRLPPERLTLQTFLGHWQASMAYSLLPYHPEYRLYEWSMKNRELQYYQMKLAGTDTYTAAQARYAALTTGPYITPDPNDPLFADIHDPQHIYHFADEMAGYMKDVKTIYPPQTPAAGTIPPAAPLTMAQLASIAAAGFSGSATQQQQQDYLSNHTLYNDTLANSEWRQFRAQYLTAREKIYEKIRKIESSESLCGQLWPDIGRKDCRNDAKCALYSDKIPVFPTQGFIAAYVNFNNIGPTPTATTGLLCPGCPGPATLVNFLNDMAASGALIKPALIGLNGARLSGIAGPSTDAALAQGKKLGWHPKGPVGGHLHWDIVNLADSAVVCSFVLDTAGTGIKLDSVQFSCLKPGAGLNDFSVMAYHDTTAKQLNGHSDCIAVQLCAGHPEYVLNYKEAEYTGLFAEMLVKLLRMVSHDQVPVTIIYNRIPASNAYLPGSDPVHAWSVTHPVSTASDFTIDLTLSPGNPLSIRLQLAHPGILNHFSDWTIASRKLGITRQNADNSSAVFDLVLCLEKNNSAVDKDTIRLHASIPLGESTEQDVSSKLCCLPIASKLGTVTIPNPAVIQAQNNHEIAVAQFKKRMADSLRTTYLAHCLQPVETFVARYQENIFHFTLSYYDAAGNLVKTVPPAGVNLIPDSRLADVAAYRSTGAGAPLMPNHTLVSQYTYNSAGSLLSAASPDAGRTSYTYDEFGRLIYRQTALQGQAGTAKKAIFTKYDNSGRIVQTGESGVEPVVLPTRIDYKDFLASLSISDKRDVFTTIYDRVPNAPNVFDIQPGTFNLKNLRNRVSATVYSADYGGGNPYTHAYFYSYDLAGNVSMLTQDLRFIQAEGALLNLGDSIRFHRLKTITYDYDLISKKANRVWYQPGQTDQFIHVYSYDADNRLTSVKTSTRPWENVLAMDNEASYQYYLHGPLARLELGQEKIQGVDYAYTLQGRIKGMNSGTLHTAEDMGQDDGSAFLPDVAGYGISYFPGDYLPAGQKDFMPPTSGAANGFSLPQYNGNIYKLMSSNQAAFASGDKTQASTFKYDALNRLTGAQVYSLVDGTLSPNYRSGYSYDPNGNLVTLSRNDQTGQLMDDLTYHYNGNNQTDRIKDAAGVKDVYDLDTDNKYVYDLNGRVKTTSGSGPTISYNWRSFDQVDNLVEQGRQIRYSYNAMRQRSWKYDLGTKTATLEVCDLQGNPIAVYTFKPNQAFLDGVPIYGQRRLGLLNTHLDLNRRAEDSTLHLIRGIKEYELADHLGSVLATVSDRRLPLAGGWSAEQLAGTNYYPFGMIEPGRDLAAHSYRYAYNGKEKDDELQGKGNAYDYGARRYDPRIARWLSLDPAADKYPGDSPYNFCLNNPVKLTDMDGKEPAYTYNAYLDQYMSNAFDYFGDQLNRSLSDAWNSPGARSIVNDKISLNLSTSLGHHAGFSHELSATWITRGTDATFVPYTTFTISAVTSPGTFATLMGGYSTGNYNAADLRQLPPGTAANALKEWSYFGSIDYALDEFGVSAYVSESFQGKQFASPQAWGTVGVNAGFSLFSGYSRSAGQSYTIPLTGFPKDDKNKVPVDQLSKKDQTTPDHSVPLK